MTQKSVKKKRPDTLKILNLEPFERDLKGLSVYKSIKDYQKGNNQNLLGKSE
jgi:hypothetical protein